MLLHYYYYHLTRRAFLTFFSVSGISALRTFSACQSTDLIRSSRQTACSIQVRSTNSWETASLRVAISHRSDEIRRHYDKLEQAVVIINNKTDCSLQPCLPASISTINLAEIKRQ